MQPLNPSPDPFLPEYPPAPEMPPFRDEEGCCCSICNIFGFCQKREGQDRIPEQHGHVEAQAYQAPSPTAPPTVALRSFMETAPESENNRLLPKSQHQSSAGVAAAPRRDDGAGKATNKVEEGRSSPAMKCSTVSSDQNSHVQPPQHRRTVSQGKSCKAWPGGAPVPTWGPSASSSPGVSGPLGQQDSRLRRGSSQGKSASRINKSSSTGSVSEISGQGGKALVPQDEDDDFCPTCLEVYTTENPKIWTACAHHFHMPCIFEWMERKDTCPICESKMSFPGLS